MDSGCTVTVIGWLWRFARVGVPSVSCWWSWCRKFVQNYTQTLVLSGLCVRALRGGIHVSVRPAFSPTLPPGRYSLSLSFSGRITRAKEGFYRSSYLNADGELEHVYSTQFQSTYARRMFPCFDEPALKVDTWPWLTPLLGPNSCAWAATVLLAGYVVQHLLLLDADVFLTPG